MSIGIVLFGSVKTRPWLSNSNKLDEIPLLKYIYSFCLFRFIVKRAQLLDFPAPPYCGFTALAYARLLEGHKKIYIILKINIIFYLLAIHKGQNTKVPGASLLLPSRRRFSNTCNDEIVVKCMDDIVMKSRNQSSQHICLHDNKKRTCQEKKVAKGNKAIKPSSSGSQNTPRAFHTSAAYTISKSSIL
jgi:hypothetical protein